MLGLDTVDDLAPSELAGGVVEVVEQFKYLGLLVEACGGVIGEVSHRIAQASRAFGSLCDSVFTFSDLTMQTKRLVHRSVVLGVLLYGVETGLPESISLTLCLLYFGYKCSVEGAGHFGMVESIGDLPTQCRLRWLGHARMSDAIKTPKELVVWLAPPEVSCPWS